MSNDSTTAGYLTPIEALPPDDRELEDIFGSAIAGITGLDRNDVRPRVQPSPPNLPDQEHNWCAFAVNLTDQDTFAYQRHLPMLVTNGASQVERDVFMDVLCSFYGANSNQYLARWREGLTLQQNRAVLGTYKIKLLGLGKPVNVPSLIKDRYSRRVDFTAQFVRRVTVTYGIRHINSAGGELLTEVLPPIPITVNQP